MFQIEDDKVIAQTEELFPFRLNLVSSDELHEQVDVDSAVERFNCINFEKLFETVYEKHGEGVYDLNALTHQKININGEELPPNLLIGVEVHCKLKFDQEQFYITDTDDAEGFGFFPEIASGYDLVTWKKMVDDNTDYSERTKDTLYELIESIPQQVKEDYVGMNVVSQMPIWDRVVISKDS
jgi:hypothetical protein